MMIFFNNFFGTWTFAIFSFLIQLLISFSVISNFSASELNLEHPIFLRIHLHYIHYYLYP